MQNVTIPREVAEAISRLDGVDGLPLRTFVDIALNGGISPSANVIRRYAEEKFDTLMAALINGYDVALPPEEVIRSDWTVMKRDDRSIEFKNGYFRGVRQTLDILGIKIEGVNV